MAIARSFRALEVYDVLANLVPGSVFLLAVGSVFQVEQYIQFSTATIAAAVFLVTALVLGHIIQAFSSRMDGTPTLFGDTIRASQGEDVHDLPIRITHVEESLLPLLKRKFNLPDDFDDYGEMFRLMLSYIETTPATRALRFQALHSFHRSMWGVWFLVVGLALTGVLLKCMGVVEVRSWPALGMTIGGGVVGIRVFQRRKEKFNKRFIQYAIADFYSNQIDEINRGRGRHGS